MPARQQQEGHVGTQLELTLGDYQVRGASIAHGPRGSTFGCTIGPVSEETLAALDGAARDHRTIRLLFPEPLLLDVVELERKEPQRVRIVGRIVDPVRRTRSD
jgi:hypothetical protein